MVICLKLLLVIMLLGPPHQRYKIRWIDDETMREIQDVEKVFLALLRKLTQQEAKKEIQNYTDCVINSQKRNSSVWKMK